MDAEFQSWIQSFTTLWAALSQFLTTLTYPSRLAQIGVVVVVVAFAWLLGKRSARRMDGWMRELEGRPKWQLRTLVVLRRRLPLIWMVALLWVAVAVFAALYQFPSRRYLIVLAATIATAWLGIRLAAQLVRNRFLRQVVIRMYG